MNAPVASFPVNGPRHGAPGDAVPNQRLAVRGLSHAFALRPVLEDVELDVAAGEIVALVGPSGCGKTTLLHLCAGLLSLRGGRIESDFVRPACMFQQPRLLPWKRAIDNITLGLKAEGVARAEREARGRALGLRMGLSEPDLDKFPHQLSGGMQSRVALARALAVRPDLLLLDEPFSALDIGLKSELYALLLAHMGERPMAVLMITHDIMEAVRLADTLLVMASSPGRIVRRFAIDLPAGRRDDRFVHDVTASLLQDAVVRESFALARLDAPRAVDDGGLDASHGRAMRLVRNAGAHSGDARRRRSRC